MRKRHKNSAAAICLILLATPSQAQDLAQPGGGKVQLGAALANERTAEGSLDACEITYRLAYEDYAYRNGDLVVLNGSVSLSIGDPDKQPSVIVKMTGYDVYGDALQLAPMNYGFISIGGQSYAHQEYVLFRCDDGGLCIGYTFFDHPDLATALADRFELSFNREAGGTDVRVPINISRDYPEQGAAHLSCVLKLIGLMQQKFKQ